MSDREIKALNTIIKAYPCMSEFDKGYLLGTAESKAREKELHKRGEGTAGIVKKAL